MTPAPEQTPDLPAPLEVVKHAPMTVEEFVRLFSEITADRMRGGAWRITRCDALRGFMIGAHKDSFHIHPKGDVLSMSGTAEDDKGHNKAFHFWAKPSVMTLETIQQVAEDIVKGLAWSIVGES